MQIPSGQSVVLFFFMLFAASSCRRQDQPVTYDAVAMDRVDERDGNGEYKHRLVQVEGYLSIPQRIFTMYGGGTWVTLYERRDGGKNIETSIKVGTEGRNRLIKKADMYDEKTLKIADNHGSLLNFGDKVVIQGRMTLGASAQMQKCYIEVDNILKAESQK